jgi:hypothetical protein
MLAYAVGAREVHAEAAINDATPTSGVAGKIGVVPAVIL